jgi:hypothetical protein
MDMPGVSREQLEIELEKSWADRGSCLSTSPDGLATEHVG